MSDPLRELEEAETLKLILEGTSRETGEAFFRALVKTLATVLRTHGAWVTRLDVHGGEFESYAMWLGGDWVDEYRYAIRGTPCERVVRECSTIHVPDRVVDLFPDDPDLKPMGAVSYLGVPLVDGRGRVLGHLAVLDRRPMPEDPRALAIIKIFAARVVAELARTDAERAVREREEQLRGLLDSALDAIVQLDTDLAIVRANPAAERTLGASVDELRGRRFAGFLSRDAASKLKRFVDSLGTHPSGGMGVWVSGGLEARRADGTPFPAEASLARFSAGSEQFLTVIFRDVNQRIEAERRIETLEKEAEVLRDELREIEGVPEIVGNASCLRAMLREVAEVAGTDATVVIQGETGTGKELVARAIHAASARRDRPLVRLNCGAIPATLIESELFGHEKGAYTGATARRDGRFVLADKGTLFLDEIGELPLDLQVKLLRVLQEGELEPVGSSRTRKVDVRVIAATNRNLEKEVEENRFREDLFYRLNVFPIRVPPLRERKEDIPALAETFARRLARKLAKPIEIRPDDLRRLKESDWPGNVRELHNVIERAVITSRDGRLNLEWMLQRAPGAAPSTEVIVGSVRTRREIEAIERANIVLALRQADWKISGVDGAARLLEMKPSTLRSRMKSLKIAREKS